MQEEEMERVMVPEKLARWNAPVEPVLPAEGAVIAGIWKIFAGALVMGACVKMPEGAPVLIPPPNKPPNVAVEAGAPCAVNRLLAPGWLVCGCVCDGTFGAPAN